MPAVNNLKVYHLLKLIKQKKDVDLNLGTGFMRYVKSVVTFTCQKLQALLLLQRRQSEQINEIEMSFGAQLSKFMAFGKSVMFLENP